MAEINLPMSSMQPADSTTLPEFVVNGDIEAYGFDDAADEGGLWRIGQLPTLAADDMTIDVDFYATATTGNVIWGVQALAYTVGTDTTSIEAAAFATPVLSTATAVSGTTLVPVRATITLSTGANQDNAATGDFFILKLYRDADNASDTLSGDAFVAAVHLSFPAS